MISAFALQFVLSRHEIQNKNSLELVTFDGEYSMTTEDLPVK